MIQLGRWDNDDLPALGNQSFNDIWGWYDSSSGSEYAILGSIDSTYFIDVTQPAKPKVCDVKAGKSKGSVWRDYKTYKNYCYAVADAGDASLQIFDLSFLPDSVVTVYDSDSLLLRSHNIWIDKDRLYASTVSLKDGTRHALDVFGLENPAQPVYLGTLKAPSINGKDAFKNCHDAYIRNDTCYCSGESPGMFVFDLADMNNQRMLYSITEYPEQGYNHSSFVSGDGKTLVWADEILGLGLKVYDISDIKNVELKSVFRSTKGAVAHNPFMVDNTCYISYYHDGVYVFNLSNPAEPIVIAYYDTYPENGETYEGFEGCWGVYPFLPSGNILASDMTNGLFVLKMDKAANINQTVASKTGSIYPNPARTEVMLEGFETDEDLQIDFINPLGQVVYHTNAMSTAGKLLLLFPPTLESGYYTVLVNGTKSHLCRKLLVQKD